MWQLFGEFLLHTNSQTLSKIGKLPTLMPSNCPNAARLLSNYGHRVVKTKWAKNKEISFLTGLKIIGLDDVGVIHKITNLISGEIDVEGLDIKVGDDRE